MAPRDRLDQALDVTDSRGLSGLMVGLLGGTFMTVAYTTWGAIESFGATLFRPINALVDSLATLITGSIGGPVVMLEAAASTGVQSVTTGLFSTFGIFAYPITMVSVMLGIYVFARFWERIDLSPWGWLGDLRR
jgi:hypothetical protein